VLPRISG